MRLLSVSMRPEERQQMLHVLQRDLVPHDAERNALTRYQRQCRYRANPSMLSFFTPLSLHDITATKLESHMACDLIGERASFLTYAAPLRIIINQLHPRRRKKEDRQLPSEPYPPPAGMIRNSPGVRRRKMTTGHEARSWKLLHPGSDGGKGSQQRFSGRIDLPQPTKSASPPSHPARIRTPSAPLSTQGTSVTETCFGPCAEQIVAPEQHKMRQRNRTPALCR